VHGDRAVHARVVGGEEAQASPGDVPHPRSGRGTSVSARVARLAHLVQGVSDVATVRAGAARVISADRARGRKPMHTRRLRLPHDPLRGGAARGRRLPGRNVPRPTTTACGAGTGLRRAGTGLRRASDLEVLADEDVVRAARADDVDGVRAVAQLEHAVDGPGGVLGPRCGLGLVGRRSRDDRPRPGTPVLRDLTDGLALAGRTGDRIWGPGPIGRAVLRSRCLTRCCRNSRYRLRSRRSRSPRWRRRQRQAE